MARTPLFRDLKALMQRARAANRLNLSRGEVQDKVGAVAENYLSRRNFLLASASLASGFGLKNKAFARTREYIQIPTLQSTIPVAIVGGGLAGLTAAFRLIYGLNKPGSGNPLNRPIVPHVFEASARFGGRIFTIENLRNEPEPSFAFDERGQLITLGVPHQSAEGGGEYFDIDNHFAKSLQIQLEDFGVKFEEVVSSPELLGTVYWSRGPKTAEEVAFAFRGLAWQMKEDICHLLEDPHNMRSARRTPTHENPLGPEVKVLDNTDLFTYLKRAQSQYKPTMAEMPKEIPDWLIELVIAAYVVEFGGEAFVQNSLNLLTLVGLLCDEDIHMFGPSDYSVRLKNGSNSIIEGLLAAIPRPLLHENYVLTEIVRQKNGIYRLRFSGGGGIPVTVWAHNVVLALPLSTLNEIKSIHSTDLPLEDRSRNCIKNWSYGNLSKVLIPTWRRFWLDRPAPGNLLPSTGNMLTALGTQTMWETTETQAKSPQDRGILTCMLGGDSALYSKEAISSSVYAGLNTLYPEVKDDTDRVLIPHATSFIDSIPRLIRWNKMTHQKGGYTCAKPGHYGEYFGVLSQLGKDGLYFCGEHTSIDFQGFMEGAAETGTRVALTMRGELALFDAIKMKGRNTDTTGARS